MKLLITLLLLLPSWAFGTDECQFHLILAAPIANRGGMAFEARAASDADSAELSAFVTRIRSQLAAEGIVDNSAYDTSDLENLLAKRLAGTGGFLVIKSEGRIVGCGGLEKQSATRGILKKFYLDDSVRGKGLGQTVLDRLIAQARQMRLSEIELITRPKMVGAIRLYEKNGFRKIAEDPGPYGKLIYELKLAPTPN